MGKKNKHEEMHCIGGKAFFTGLIEMFVTYLLPPNAHITSEITNYKEPR